MPLNVWLKYEMKSLGPKSRWKCLEKTKKVWVRWEQGEGGGRRHVENSDTADMINEFTKI